MVGITDVDKPRKRKSHVNSVAFSEEEEIINPEDVDPSIGKFRNMIQTTIIPTKVKYCYGCMSLHGYFFTYYIIHAWRMILGSRFFKQIIIMYNIIIINFIIASETQQWWGHGDHTHQSDGQVHSTTELPDGPLYGRPPPLLPRGNINLNHRRICGWLPLHQRNICWWVSGHAMVLCTVSHTVTLTTNIHPHTLIHSHGIGKIPLSSLNLVNWYFFFLLFFSLPI